MGSHDETAAEEEGEQGFPLRRSLFGLAQSPHEQGKNEQAAETDARFQKIWGETGMKVTSSCLCQPGK